MAAMTAVIDAWMQHPTLRFLGQDMFESLRRWAGTEIPTEELPLELTMAAMDQASVERGLISAWYGPDGPLITNDEVAGFVARYPNSTLMPEAKARLRDARDRLSEADYEVGFFYYRQRWYPGAVDRFKSLLKQDPEFTNRDAVYFYLAESLVKTKQKAEALPYYQKLIEEFRQSEYLTDANKRIAELKAPEVKS